MNKIFLLLVVLTSFRLSAETLHVHDSTGIEKKDGKLFIVHKVEPKETFYSISRRYAVTVDDIKKYNPESSAGLKIGQTILIPSKAKMPATANANAQVTPQKVNNEVKGPVTHNVAS